MTSQTWLLLLGTLTALSGRGAAAADAAEPAWTSPNRYRVLLVVDPRGVKRSNSPASVEIDFPRLLKEQGASGRFDEHTVEVVTCDAAGQPRVYGDSRAGDERYRVAHRIERLYGADAAILSFVLPDETCTRCAVYFDTVESGLGKPQRYPGLVGDGDYFREHYQCREINASKFDTFCDFDGDGDPDLFKGGVEPFVHCYENVGGNRLVDRGWLSSGGKPLMMPCHDQDNGRGWMTVEFCDWDGDGDQDLFPCMGDGPQAGQVLVYENATVRGGLLTFTSRGPLSAGGDKRVGGRFVALTFVDWDADGKLDILAAGHASPMFFRNVGPSRDIGRIELAEGVPVRANGKDFTFVPARVDAADMDGDGDLDLLATESCGPIHLFMNTGSRTQPILDAGIVVAYTGGYLIGDAHTGVKAADFDGDGLVDIVGGRFWERTPLAEAHLPRYYGGLFKNVGPRDRPRFEKRDASHGSPYTQGFHICDAVRQSGVRGVDWDNDGRTDLIAGDTDGFVWLFRNQTDNHFPVFATGEKLYAGGELLHRHKNGGHARPDICDWDNDGKKDLVLADGGGAVIVYLNVGTDDRPVLSAGQAIEADGEPIHGKAGRASVAVGDWDNDGKKDLVFADQDRAQGYRFCRNVGTDAEPAFTAGKVILFGGRLTGYVRPNLGEIVDWDGDGKQDLIACNFEVDIRFYRNVGSGAAGEEPRFADFEGTVIVRPFTVQMVSGADVLDFNADGDLDILTGQGHGGSGLRFYERDYIEDQLNQTSPVVTVQGAQRRL